MACYNSRSAEGGTVSFNQSFVMIVGLLLVVANPVSAFGRKCHGSCGQSQTFWCGNGQCGGDSGYGWSTSTSATWATQTPTAGGYYQSVTANFQPSYPAPTTSYQFMPTADGNTANITITGENGKVLYSGKVYMTPSGISNTPPILPAPTPVK